MNSYTVHTDINRFIHSLTESDRIKVGKVIEILEKKEYALEMPYSKKIERDLYELRIKGSKNIRIFYTFYRDSIFLLHVIKKQSQKLALKDLNTARNRLKVLHS